MSTSADATAAPSQIFVPAPEAGTRTAAIVQPGGGTPVRAFGNEIVFKLMAAQTAGSLTLGLATVSIGHAPPLHVHQGDDEIFILVEGQYRVYLDGTWTDAGPGTVVYLPRGAAHTFQVTGDTPGKHWVILTPSGFEDFYAKCEAASAGGPPDFARMAAITREHGYEMVSDPRFAL